MGKMTHLPLPRQEYRSRHMASSGVFQEYRYMMVNGNRRVHVHVHKFIVPERQAL